MNQQRRPKKIPFFEGAIIHYKYVDVFHSVDFDSFILKGKVYPCTQIWWGRNNAMTSIHNITPENYYVCTACTMRNDPFSKLNLLTFKLSHVSTICPLGYKHLRFDRS